MVLFDAHCDTLTRIMENKSGLYKNECHIDLNRMQVSGYRHVQFFAAFIEPKYCQAYAMKRAMQIIDKYYEQEALFSDSIALCLNLDGIESALKQGKTAALLSIEGGDALQGDPGALRMFYKLGIRSICLTWNYRNEIADGVKDGSTGGGLTPFGREVVKEMNRLGMLADVSHISEKGFWDVLEVTTSPIMVSHSNAKAVCPHPRNLTDEQICAVKKNGGVIGVNLYPPFLNASGTASLDDITKHIEHISGLAGFDHIGFGADFDGIDETPAGIKGIQDMDIIFNRLLQLNYTEECVEKIAGRSLLELVSKIL